MQVCKCSVLIGGDRNHVVNKKDVTVAEIEILRVLHGEDAVIDIKPTKQDTRKHADELARLKTIYRKRLPGPDASGQKNIVDIVYSGPRPKLPANLKDIGVDYPVKKGAAKDAADVDDTDVADTKE